MAKQAKQETVECRDVWPCIVCLALATQMLIWSYFGRVLGALNIVSGNIGSMNKKTMSRAEADREMLAHLPPRALPFDEALRFAEARYDCKLAVAAKVLASQCKDTMDFTGKHDIVSVYKGLELGQHYASPANDACRFVMSLVQVQLPLSERHRTTFTEWSKVMKASMRDGDPHHDGSAICVLASYALVPYPLECAGQDRTSNKSQLFSPEGCVANSAVAALEEGIKPAVKSNSLNGDKSVEPVAKLAVATLYSGEFQQRGSCGFMRSSCWNSIEVHMVHAREWRGLGQKVEMARLLLDQLSSRQQREPNTRLIVMLVDAYDTLMQVPPDEIKQRFLASGHEVIISSEHNCFPFGLPGHDLGISACRLFPARHGPMQRRYPNSGGIIGYVDALRDIYQTTSEVPPGMLNAWPGTDQGYMGMIYLSRRFRGFAIDARSVFWATTGPLRRANDTRGVSWSAGPHDAASSSQWPTKRARPSAALHFNGGGESAVVVSVHRAQRHSTLAGTPVHSLWRGKERT